MTTQTEALKLALDYLYDHRMGGNVIAAIKEALANHIEDNLAMAAQPEQETCKGCNGNGVVGNILDTVPCPFCKGTGVEAQPEQKSVGLDTVYEIIIQWDEGGGKRSRRELARRIMLLFAHTFVEPVPVHQFRTPYSSDWYDGIPDHHDGHGPYEIRTLYTTPPQRKPLTDEQIEAIWRDGIYSEGLLYEFNLFARAIEAKLKEKNT